MASQELTLMLEFQTGSGIQEGNEIIIKVA